MSYLGLNYIGRLVSNFKDYYAGINAATLTGAIDVIIVQQDDGTFISSPFHVRFGKLGVLRSREKIVDIEINGEPADIHMKLGESGEAFFVVEADADDTNLPKHLVTSPLPPFDNPEATLTSVSPEPPLEIKVSQDDRVGPSNLPPNLDLLNIRAVRQDSLMGKRQEDLLAALKQCGLEADKHTPSPSETHMEAKVFQATTVTEAGQVDVPFRPIVDGPAEQLVRGNEADVQRRSTPGKARQTKRRRSFKKKKGNNRRSVDNSAALSGLGIFRAEEGPGNDEMGNSDNEPVDGEVEDIVSRGTALPHSEPVTAQHEVQIPIVQIASPQASQENNWGAVAKSMGPDFHFFSDTEIFSPEGSRPGSPAHSDSEYELGSYRDRSQALSGAVDNNQQSWRWGELPSPPAPRPSPVLAQNVPSTHDATKVDSKSSELSTTDTDVATQNAQAHSEAQRSMLSSMFSFMRQTKKLRHDASSKPSGKAGQPVKGEIYLDDLNTDDLDPELAALYFPPQHLQYVPPPSEAQISVKDEDTESGRGASLPHSPPTLATDSDSEELHRKRHSTLEGRKEFPEIAVSLCGGLGDMPEPPESLFLQYLVTFDDLAENPKLLESPDLVVKVDSKYYSWNAASPLVMSWLLFGRPLPSHSVDVLTGHPPGASALSAAAEGAKKDESPRERSYSWWSWRRSQPQSKKGTEGSTGSVDEHFKGSQPETTQEQLQSVVVEPLKDVKSSESEICVTHTESTEVRVSSTSSDDSDVGDSSSPRKIPFARRSYYDASDKYRKTLRLSSTEIASLQLRGGPNEAVFSVTTAYQGTTRCKCHIYLWKYDDKVVISDIDGTITKSDVLGHILPIVGKDWAQSGVAQLFTKIKNNGYRILYLSARAIGQASVTREYLRSVNQGGLSLPDGPLLLNPTSLLSAFHREVIEKKPEEFKISCLRDIQALFPQSSNPFYAGYGNKVNDVWAYRAVGIPISRIFTINHKGELKHELTETFQSSYCKQSFIVDLVFPPLKASQPTSHEVSDFSQHSYWREPLPELAPADCELLCAPYADKQSKSRKVSRKEK